LSFCKIYRSTEFLTQKEELFRPIIDLMKSIITLFLGLSLSLLSIAQTNDNAELSPQTGLPRIKIQAGINIIDAQVAVSVIEREIGLMHRTQMPPNEGMLFIFEQSSKQCFWMKNTLMPLTAAFIDNNGVIVNLADMQPKTETPHCSNQPVRFVLEMYQGWFAKHGLKAGSKLSAGVFNK
jgi:uncharacterized protein